MTEAPLTPRSRRPTLGSRMSMFFRKSPIALEGLEDVKPPLKIPDRLEKLQKGYENMMKFYKNNGKKVEELRQHGDKLAESERIVGAMMNEFVDENEGLSVGENMGKFSNILKSLSALRGSVQTVMENYNIQLNDLLENDNNVPKLKKEWESVRNEYEKFVLVIPTDEALKTATMKDFDVLCGRVNEAFSNYMNELEFQIRRRDHLYGDSISNMIYAYACYFETGSHLFSDVNLTGDDVSKKKNNESNIFENVKFKPNFSNVARILSKVNNKHVIVSSEIFNQSKVFGAEFTQIPPSIKQLFDIVEEKGLNEVGIFRLSGDDTFVKEQSLLIDKGEMITQQSKSTFVHSCASLIKLYIRKMPEPLMTWAAFPELIQVKPTTETLQTFISQLPHNNLKLLQLLLSLLKKISLNAATNKMNAMNLGVIFGMNIFRMKEEDQMVIAANVGNIGTVAATLIDGYGQHWFTDQPVTLPEIPNSSENLPQSCTSETITPPDNPLTPEGYSSPSEEFVSVKQTRFQFSLKLEDIQKQSEPNVGIEDESDESSCTTDNTATEEKTAETVTPRETSYLDPSIGSALPIANNTSGTKTRKKSIVQMFVKKNALKL